MNKVLGLDLGTNSLGWAVIDNENQKIEDAGVRIFPMGLKADTINQGKKEISKNAERRLHRQMRRNFYRKRLRKIKLLEVLIDEGMCPLTINELNHWKHWYRNSNSLRRQFPDSPAFKEWLALNPYELRYKALRQDLTLHELGRIFYHMIQRRGFISTRKGSADFETDDKSVVKKSINEISRSLGNRTLGEYFYENVQKQKESYSKPDNGKPTPKVRGNYTLRDMYVEEFDKIWQKQAKHLGLDKKTKTVTKIRYVRGSMNEKRIKEKINHLIEKYGKDNVQIDGKYIITKEVLPLKEYLGGTIWYEDGRLKYKSNESVLFWQRPLRTQKHLLGECRYEKTVQLTKGEKTIYIRKGKKTAPVSHPLFELFRAYQFVNNISAGKNRLTPEQREMVIELINKKSSHFNFKEIPKKLKMTYENFNYADDYKVAGNPTICQLSKLFPKDVLEKHLIDIWHCFYFFDDNERLYKKLKNDYNLLTENIKDIARVRLADGYSSISIKAIKNILPYLIKGHKYSHAVILGGVKNTFGKRWDYFSSDHQRIESDICKIIRKEHADGEMIESIKDYLSNKELHYGFEKNDPAFTRLYHPSQEVQKKEKAGILSEIENLRNPIVQQALNELRRVVNSLIFQYKKKYGEHFYFNEIHVEFARELKLSKVQRQEIKKLIDENERKNFEARERIQEYGLRPSRENIQKFILYKEIEDRNGWVQCPYTGKAINMYDLLGASNTIQIEHIIPYSISLDDSLSNKTLCEANFNREKGELTPYDFYEKNPDPALWGGLNSWLQVEQRAFKLLPYKKAKRFTSRKDYKDSRVREDFIERQLNDTRYISKKAAEILTEICDKILVMSGQLTAELRHLWGLNSILQTTPLHLSDLHIDEERPVAYKVLLSKDGTPRKAVRVKNPKPVSHAGEILIPGEINGHHFRSEFIGEKTFTTEGFKDGRYWMRVSVEKSVRLQPVFRDKPELSADYLTLRGTVQNGKFVNDTLNKNVPVTLSDGTYWASFPVLNYKVYPPDKRPDEKGGRPQINLFGHVQDGIFTSFIYQRTLDYENDSCWISIEPDITKGKFLRVQNDEPSVNDDELLLKGVVNQQKNFVPEADRDFHLSVEEIPGNYWCVFKISKIEGYYPVENELKIKEKGEKVIEGDIWLDKSTGEIKFDSRKSREDNRHHAIDAIIIALTTRSHIQKLSTYNAHRKGWMRGQEDRPRFEPPWEGFRNDAKNAVEKILVSYRKNDQILTKITRRFIKQGRPLRSVGYAARGELHRDTFFGKRKSPVHNDYGYHVRKSINNIKTDKHVNKIADKKIRMMILQKLQDEYQIDTSKPFTIPKYFFFDAENKPALYMPNKQGDPVPVLKVRMREHIGNAVRLKQGKNIWVNPYNNHHVVIYENHAGDLCEDVVTLWQVVDRQLKGEPVYQLPPDGKRIITTMKENDMFLLGLKDIVSEQPDPEVIARHLYRVQKISGMYYTFRFHRAANIKDDSTEVRIRSFSRWKELNPIKVNVDVTGNLTIM